MNLLVGLVVYNRLYTVEKWLKAWSKAVKPNNAKLAVFHNYDGKEPQKDQRELILDGKPDFYIPRPNFCCDMGAFHDVASGLYVDYDWDELAWFADDFLPMKKDFLLPFVEKLQPDCVGLVGACYEPVNQNNLNGHFRTVGFMIKKSVINKLKFPSISINSIGTEARRYSFAMEHGFNNMTMQVKALGFDAIPAIGNKFPEPGYSHWPNNSHWMWDCEKLKHLNLMGEFDKEFA